MTTREKAEQAALSVIIRHPVAAATARDAAAVVSDVWQERVDEAFLRAIKDFSDRGEVRTVEYLTEMRNEIVG